MEGEEGGITLFASSRAPERSNKGVDVLESASRVARSASVTKRARAAEVGEDSGSVALPRGARSGASSAADVQTGLQETQDAQDEAADTFSSGETFARRSNVSGAENSWEEGGADASTSPETFSSLGLPPWLARTCESLGMTSPTPVQRAVIPALLRGRDAIAIAHTGSGKTASFALPILSALAPDPYGVFALVLSPTRELAFQLAEQFRALGVGCGLRDAVVVGGLDQLSQARELSRRPHVVVASPGRLRALFAADPSLRGAFAKLRFLVMDEADRLLEDSFESDLAAVLQGVAPRPRSDGDGSARQTVLVSATLTPAMWELRGELPPTALLWRAYRGLETVRGSKLREEYALVPARVKNVYAAHVLARLQDFGVRSAIVFAATCAGCEALAALLRELELPCAQLSSGLAQRQRLAALDRFRSGRVPVLVATDVAARGLDIPAVDLVLNFDLPRLARDYVHRVGRTARAGRGGWALSLVSQHDVDLVHRIESLVGHQLVATDACPEKEVLKGLHRVFEAQRVAALAVQDRQRKVDQRAGGGRAVLRERSKKRQARLDARAAS